METVKAIIFRDLRGLHNVIEWAMMVFALLVFFMFEVWGDWDSEGFILASVVIGYMAVSYPMVLLAEDREKGVINIIHVAGVRYWKYLIGKMVAPLISAWLVMLLGIACSIWVTNGNIFSRSGVVDIAVSMALLSLSVIMAMSFSYMVSMIGKESTAVLRMSSASLLVTFMMGVMATLLMHGFPAVHVFIIFLAITFIAVMVALIAAYGKSAVVLHTLQ